MTKREVTEVVEGYRDTDGKRRYALKGAIVDDGKPAPKGEGKPAPQKRAAPAKKAARRK